MLGRLFLGRNWCGNQNPLCFPALAETTNAVRGRLDDGPAPRPYLASRGARTFMVPQRFLGHGHKGHKEHRPNDPEARGPPMPLWSPCSMALEDAQSHLHGHCSPAAVNIAPGPHLRTCTQEEGVTGIVEAPRPQRWLPLLQRTSQKSPPHTPTPSRG
jgi:hypothetical protein